MQLHFLVIRRKTGAFRPKDVCEKQLLTGAKGYRLRDTDDRINRDADLAERKPAKGNKDIGPPLNHMGTQSGLLLSQAV